MKTIDIRMIIYFTCKLWKVDFFEFVKAYLDGKIDGIQMPVIITAAA